MNSKLKKLIVTIIGTVSAAVAGYFGMDIQPETIEQIVNIVADLVAQ